jgi:uncharacterized membrane protein YkoI
MAALERFVSAASLALALASVSACAQDFQSRPPDAHAHVSQAQASPAQEPHAQEPHAQESQESSTQEPTRTGHIPTGHFCLDQKERRAESTSGAVVRLAAAIHAAKSRMPGTVVQARLCHGQDGLVYVLTVLAHDGKVARIFVDAAKGTLVGER